MNLKRRTLLTSAIPAAVAVRALITNSFAAETNRPHPTGMRLGTVTYNIANDWDISKIIKNLESTKFEGVELRTTHAHRVEVSLSKTERADVKKRFADSKVELMGLGSAFEFQMPDQQ